MLELKSITKVYPTGSESVHALKGIDLKFRKNEFVSILGPSGCGKTTMLNIVGGLDHYTDGDLIINGISTKQYKDRDWDAYRNYSIGFVFQSYNLIPHQTVLKNVELALTLSGVSKNERHRRAVEALERVGLGSQLKKKPGEMSGGQCQRVAIARAIVNDPDIILADEPTGALDTETSVQVMDILKDIAKDRLVIMVTHNPELAEKYSTRIVRMLDGVIVSDSAPLSDEEIQKETDADKKKHEAEKARKKKLPSMSFATSFGLSLNNLFTKKGRTVLTSFAGSIGIIGIALIYAVSQGTTMYIDSVQEQTLSSYPLSLEASHVDTSSLITNFMGKAESTQDHENDAVYQKAMVYDLINAMNSIEEDKNDLKAFKAYLEKERSDKNSKLHKAISGVKYSYNTNMAVYTKSVDGKIIISDAQNLLTELMSDYLGSDMQSLVALRDSMTMGTMDSMLTSGSKTWKELLPGDNGKSVNPVIEEQYDLLYGTWPNDYNEVVLFVDENNELSDLTLYALGLRPEKEIKDMLDAAFNMESVEYEAKSWSYEELCNMEFRTVLPSDCYAYDDNTDTYKDLRKSEAGMKYLYEKGISLKVCGVVKPNEDAVSTGANGHIGYTHKLTEYIIKSAEQSGAIRAQLDNPAKDIFTGLPFKETSDGNGTKNRADDFREYVSSMSKSEKADLFIKIKSEPTEDEIKKYSDEKTDSISRSDIEKSISKAMSSRMGMDESSIKKYIVAMGDEELKELYVQMIEEEFKIQYAMKAKEKYSSKSDSELAAELDKEIKDYDDEKCAELYSSVVDFSSSTYEDNLKKLGYVEIDNPDMISLYAASFADKDVIEEAIKEYNESVDDMQEIQYTDYVGLMMSSVTMIINAITYILIAFVAVSLIVSSIMIGVITLISVQERTKEIGILRAIGASKKNVSSMFNAETVIIGFTSGLLGVIITYLLCIPINIIVHSLTEINNLSAYLPPVTAVILVIISVLLTLIAGIIPSGSAAKKDPVVALRTE